MWSHQETVSTKASPEAVWNLWSHPETWPVWDEGLEEVRLEGEFRRGAQGFLKPKGGPKMSYRLEEVTPLASFADLTRLFFTDIRFIHSIRRSSGTTIEVTHRVEISGLLTFLLRRTLGAELQKNLRHTIETLTRAAESRSVAA